MNLLRKGAITGLLALATVLFSPIIPSTGDTYNFTVSNVGKKCELREEKRSAAYSLARDIFGHNKYDKGVVRIIVAMKYGTEYKIGMGVGYEIGPGLILTANHVVGDSGIYVILNANESNEKSRLSRARVGVVVSSNPHDDLALVSVSHDRSDDKVRGGVKFRKNETKMDKDAMLKTINPQDVEYNDKFSQVSIGMETTKDFTMTKLTAVDENSRSYLTVRDPYPDVTNKIGFKVYRDPSLVVLPVRGMSGSSVVDKKGRIIGVLTNATTEEEQFPDRIGKWTTIDRYAFSSRPSTTVDFLKTYCSSLTQ